MAIHKLTAVEVKNAAKGKYSDGNGLWLYKGPLSGKWVLRYFIYGQRREMGLGSIQKVSLQKAREAANKWRMIVAEGKDAIKERDRQIREDAKKIHTLADVAADAYETRKAQLKGDGKAGRWFSPLEIHVLPKLGKIPINEIDQHDIRRVLAPIWHTKASTALKAADRLNIVLNHASALDLDVDVQSVAKARSLLGQQRHQVQPIPSLCWEEVPEFYASLEEPTITHLALRLLILTSVRSAPLRFIRLDEIEGDVWTVPAANMKAVKGKEQDFRVPLSKEALAVIDLAKPFERDGFLFPSVRKGVISDATMARLMERRGMKARPHGFRSSIRTWLSERTDAPHEVAEAVLSHVTDGKVVRSYRRTDFLEQRRILMERWAMHVTGQGSADVVRLVAKS